MPITDEDLQELIDEMDRGRARWISGQIDSGEDPSYRQADDMTIFSPFGGAGPRPGELTAHELASRQAAAAALFHGGAGSSEVLRTIVDGDLVVLVMIERSEVMFEGRDRPHPWVLRTTQVFRRIDRTWVRLHRHADPLIVLRPLDATLQLLAGA
jgi:hypothetical protein